MVQYCFMSTETTRLIRTESPGQPPWLSHSSWTLHIMCRDHRIYVLLRSRQTSVCDFSYLSIAETTRFLHPLEKQEDRCLWLQLYNDFSYISVAETTHFYILLRSRWTGVCDFSYLFILWLICLYCDFSYLPMQSLQLSTYAVISVIYLYSHFSYLSIQWLQLSTYTVTSVIYQAVTCYTVYTILVSIYSRDHKISMSSWKASIQLSATSVIYL